MRMRASNRIVHGLWVGRYLPRLHRLGPASFLAHGHEFHLWCYERPSVALPGVVLRPADEILPRARIFRRRARDLEAGVGAGSLAPFADLFRAKLLYEHGGIWADLDLTCLRRFDFAEPYVFRAHHVGVVDNLIKVPRGAPVMKALYDEMAERIDADSPWHAFNRGFAAQVRAHGLEGLVRDDLAPPDDFGALRPLLTGDPPLDPRWYAIHWMHELWRTLRISGGLYRGTRLIDVAPDADHPEPGTTFARLLEAHGLLDPARAIAPEPAPVPCAPAAAQPFRPTVNAPMHVNVLVASMALGGAEKIVRDQLRGLGRRKASAKLFVLRDASPAHPTDDLERCQTVKFGALVPSSRVRAAALETLASPVPALYAHLVHARALEPLGRAGVRAIPVVHNTQQGWLDAPAEYDRPFIPLVVACADEVKRQLVDLGCPRPVVTLRHELGEARVPADLARDRTEIRRRHGIPDGVALVGMVGEFKAQKAYTRAVRVLAELRTRIDCRLMILGGWDHEWGQGRAAYSAACRQAVELGVMADLILPGAIHPAAPYYAAFDVLLNTSVYEGLSIAVLEAIQSGCPVVTADAGGNREALGPDDALIADPADTTAYVDAMLRALARTERRVPPPREDPDLVPRMWCLLARYGLPGPRPPGRTMFVTENLGFGGAQRSLRNLLTHLPAPAAAIVAVLAPSSTDDHLRALEAAGVPVVALHPSPGRLDQVERLLYLAEQAGCGTIAFWNAPAATKLAVAKALEVSAVRLIDVSPGPAMRRELDDAAGFGHRLALSPAQYLGRLDAVVVKDASGLADLPEARCVVIPNGVAAVAPCAPAALAERFARFDPRLAIGTVGRITPGKRLEVLIDMMAVLARTLPDATLTIVGGHEPRHAGYGAYLARKVANAGLTSVAFVGPAAEVAPYLAAFQVVVQLDDEAGCPNASLEAMAAGLPVVGNAVGGAAAQIVDGKTGVVVDADDPVGVAAAVAALLGDPRRRRRLGAAARRHVEAGFAMDAMVRGYRALLDGPRAEVVPLRAARAATRTRRGATARRKARR